MQVIDAYHKKTGERKIRLGNQDLQRTWKMKQNHLSPKYTTDFKDIFKVKVWDYKQKLLNHFKQP